MRIGSSSCCCGRQTNNSLQNLNQSRLAENEGVYLLFIHLAPNQVEAMTSKHLNISTELG